ncbi:type II toxin-antitoxin system prevent-host-death family antitoxin [Bartonella queenslandensis]|uniref:type II toxin-antitoxin system prevent-host-death family antitoxin n=1 Tax=Bartonella queenslandensis TaxID=481138 RepID=UPI00031D0B7E|nr:type II toxin-antitoxin system prevent-host-death family antitoxin [Bartonella queenslandensis]
MKKYSFTDINRGTGDILDEAMSTPVALTKRGREKIIMLPIHLYNQLIKSRSATQAFSYADAPKHILDDLEQGLDELLKSDENV